MGWRLKTSDANVIFDGYLHADRYKTLGIIPYSGTNTNLGNGLNITDGTFNAPVSGIYFFHFQGLTWSSFSWASYDSFISMKQNGRVVASSFWSKHDVSLNN